MHNDLPASDIADIRQAHKSLAELIADFQAEAEGFDPASLDDRQALADYAGEIVATISDLNQFEDAQISAALGSVAA